MNGNQKEKNLQFQENEEMVKFRTERTAFTIVENYLIIQPKQTNYSHLSWLLHSGFSEEDSDKIIEHNARGYFHQDHGLFFYFGYEYLISEKTEKQFFSFLPEIVKRIEIKDLSTQIYGGAIPNNSSTKWKPRKSYGTVLKHL